MNKGNHHNKIVYLMIQNEETYAKLYQKYAAIFPGQRVFWNALAKEELLHSQWLKALLESPDTITDEKIVNPAMIEMTIQTIETEIKSNVEMTYVQALKKALALEHTFLENHFFEIFSGANSKFEQVINRLRDETSQHAAKIKFEIDKLDEE